MLKSLLTRSVHNNQLKLGVRFRGLGPKHKVKSIRMREGSLLTELCGKGMLNVCAFRVPI